MRRHLKTFGWVFATIAWVGVSFMLAVLLAGLLISALNLIGLPLAALGQNAAAFVANAIAWSLMLPILVIPPLKLGLINNLKEELGLTRLLSWKDIGLSVLGYIPYIILSLVLNGLAIALLMQYGYDPAETQDVGFSDIASSTEMILAFIALVVLAPLVEEIMFRGFLYSQLKRRVGLIVSIVLTSVVFGILHMQLNVGIDVFALSIVLCILREITGSIWAGVLLHSLKNGLAFTILFILPPVMPS